MFKATTLGPQGLSAPSHGNNSTCVNIILVSVRHVADPDPKGGIGIHLSQYSEELFIIFRPLTIKGCLRIFKFHLKVPLTLSHGTQLIAYRMQESVIRILGNLFKVVPEGFNG